MDSIEMTFQALGNQIQQNERRQERLEKQKEQKRADKTDLSKAIKDGKITNPLLLIFFLQIQGMKSMSKGLTPSLAENKILENQYKAKMDKVAELNKQLKAVLADPNYNENDQTKALNLQNEISETQVDAQTIQQKEQSMWTLGIQSQESNVEGASNMAANSIQMLNQSRQQFLSA